MNRLWGINQTKLKETLDALDPQRLSDLENTMSQEIDSLQRRQAPRQHLVWWRQRRRDSRVEAVSGRYFSPLQSLIRPPGPLRVNRCEPNSRVSFDNRG